MFTARRLILVLMLAVIALLAGGLAKPGMAACGLIDLIPRASATDVETGLVADARRRIHQSFGPPIAEPRIVFWDRRGLLGMLLLNEYGSMEVIGARACVFVGPKGRTADIVAHELMHAELFARVGAWAYLARIPTWFNEGLAMQVDHRERYLLPKGTDSEFVRNATSAGDFFVGGDEELTRNYAAAKAQVARWVATVGASSVYGQLGRIQAGEPFDGLVAK